MKPAVLAGMVFLPLGLGTCAWLASTSADIVRPVVRDDVGAALSRAAMAAQGQRLLVIVAKPGTATSSAIYDSSEVPGGWGAFPPTADPADPLLPALDALAARAAEELVRDTHLSKTTTDALGIFGVAIVLVTDGTSAQPPNVGERDPNLGIAYDVPAWRVRHAEPAFQFLAEGPSTDPSDPFGFVRGLRKGGASLRGVTDRSPWGGDVVVEAHAPSKFLLSWPAHGARVTVDGGPAEFRPASVPMLVVSTPAGRHEISVRYGDQNMVRQSLAIAAAFVAFASAIALWLGLRPVPPPAQGAGA